MVFVVMVGGSEFHMAYVRLTFPFGMVRNFCSISLLSRLTPANHSVVKRAPLFSCDRSALQIHHYDTC